MSRNITVKAPAKVNLALDILDKDPSGYHQIRTVLTFFPALADEIFIEEAAPPGRGDTRLSSGTQYGGFDVEFPNAPELEAENTVRGVLTFLKREFYDTPSVYVRVQKNIPAMSGLGGGSSDAAAVLKVLGEWWRIPREELVNIAEKVGMDCAFFLIDKLVLASDGNPRDPSSAADSRSRRALAFDTALGEHFGEKITPLPSLPGSVKIEIIETGVRVATSDAYGFVDLSRCGTRTADTDKLIAALHAGDTAGIIKYIHNDFEEFVFAAYPELLEKKRVLEKEKPGRILLCGSGGALMRFG